MLPPLVSAPGIHFDCTDEELFNSLVRMAGGCPLPENVIVEINPYDYAPSNLPEGIWYLVRSKETGATKFGYWKVKGEARKLFSNDMITGWRTTLEFFEGQAPHEHKTDWLMQEYWITDKGLGESSKIKEANSLCRVFLGGKQGLGHEKQLKIGNPHIANDTLVAESVLPQINSGTRSGSTSKHLEDKDDETGVLAVTGNPQHPLVVNRPEAYFADGDFLELLDLEEPASPSSSSDNSSCLTMSSDELDFDSNRGNEDWHFNVSASSMPNEVVISPASPGSLSRHKESNASAEAILGVGTVSAVSAPVGTSRSLANVPRNRKASYRDEGPSSSHNGGASSSRNNLSEDEEKKAARDRKKKQKKNKYMCFMPFYFLF